MRYKPTEEWEASSRQLFKLTEQSLAWSQLITTVFNSQKVTFWTNRENFLKALVTKTSLESVKLHSSLKKLKKAIL